jgi:hypothetical protein
LPKVLATRGAPEHAAEAALAEGVATHEDARHNPLAAPHRQSERPAAGGLRDSKTNDLDVARIVPRRFRMM